MCDFDIYLCTKGKAELIETIDSHQVGIIMTNNLPDNVDDGSRLLQSETEIIVKRMWQEVLGIDPDIDDDFFELGG